MPVELIKALPTYGPVGIAVLILLYAIVKLFLLLMDSYKAQNQHYRTQGDERSKQLMEAVKVIDSNSRIAAEVIETLELSNTIHEEHIRLLEASGIKVRRDRVARDKDKDNADKKR